MDAGGYSMYKGRLFIRQLAYVCGNFMDADIFPVFQKPGMRRTRCKPSSEVQKKLNQKNAERKVTRQAHANFTEEDIALHLSYGRQPGNPEEALRHLSNFIKRIKRARKKAGLPPLKYMSSTERGKKSGRYHHHLIVSGGLDRDYLEKLWGMGTCNSRRLQFGPDGIAGLTHYMAKDHLCFKRWNASRNLIKPSPGEKNGKIPVEDLDEMGEAADAGMAFEDLEDLYPGWECIKTEAVRNECNKGWYIHAEFRKREKEKRRRGG
jgi:hypothetical protein